MVQWLGRLLYTQKATGSIPVTEILHRFQLFFAVVQNTQLANFNSARGFVFATMSQVASLAELRRLGGVSSVIRLLDKSFVGDEEDGNKTSAATPAAAPAPARVRPVSPRTPDEAESEAPAAAAAAPRREAPLRLMIASWRLRGRSLSLWLWFCIDKAHRIKRETRERDKDNEQRHKSIVDAFTVMNQLDTPWLL